MRPMVPVVVLASSLLALLPSAATAQCEGGTQMSGGYLPNGTYVGGGCHHTNPTTPQQLYPSGAQVAPSTNPALGASRLPGQTQPSDLIPVNTTDPGPAPSLLNRPDGLAGLPPSSSAAASLLPCQLPPSGNPALTGNRAVPSSGVSSGAASPLSTALDPSGVYGSSVPAAPVPAEEPDPGEPPAPGRGGPTVIGH
jgi:hypothetical protein